MPDRMIECVDCHQEFTHSEGAQEFFKEKGFTDPKRCSDCRKAKNERNDKSGKRK